MVLDSLATNAVSVSVDMRGNETVSVTALDPETQSSFSTTVLPGLNNAAVNWYNDGMVVSNISHSAVVTAIERDALRRETARIDGRGNVSRTRYDALGRVAATIDALTNATAYAYDAMGRVAAITNALGETIVYAYDTRGNRISERGATYPVDYTYDAYGDKIAMTTYRDESLATGDVTHWFYDESSGTLTNKVYADGQGPRYEYDANGRLEKRTWARGVETFYAYDGWGNLTNTTYSDNTPTIALRYDALGRQVEAHDAAGVTTFQYDAYGALTNETVIGVAGTNVIERFHDEYGRNAGYALNGIRQTTIAYDPATGRLATMRTAERRSGVLTASDENEFVWSYLPNSDLKASLQYPNGMTASWTYDANSQLLQVRNATPSAIISQYDYTYDSAGRRIARAHSGTAFAQSDTIDYAYNIKSELTNAVAVADSNYTYAYDFDEIGNRRTSSECGVRSAVYASNELNQYTAISTDTSALFVSPCETFTPLFDADGNQTLVKTATGIWTVTYNGENRPILWTCGETNIVMSYDRMGRRVTKSAECGGQSAECCRFVYDGYLQIANHHSTPTPSPYTYFIWDPTEPVATRPLVWLNSALDTPHSALYYTHDGNKNVSEVIADNCDIAAHYEYAPFGSVAVQSGESAATNPWRFSSEFADDELGCDYYNYREYEPMMGRWMSRDMMQEHGGFLLYGFTQNNSMSKVDLIGLKESVKACSNANDCKTNIKLLSDGLALSKKRYDEFFNPQFIKEALENLLLPIERQYKPGRTDVRGREAWDGHVQAFKDRLRHNSNCVEVILKQLSEGKCECCDPNQVLDMLIAVESVLSVYNRNLPELAVDWGDKAPPVFPPVPDVEYSSDWGDVGEFVFQGLGVVLSGGAVVFAIIPFDGPLGEVGCCGAAAAAFARAAALAAPNVIRFSYLYK